MAVQIIRPTADESAVGWTATPPSPATIFDKIDETVADDGDYGSSPSAPSSGDFYEVRLSSASDPLSSDDHQFSYRVRKDIAGGAQINLTVELREGASTVIETWNHTDISNAWTTFVQVLAALEADSITDYTDLRLRFIFEQV